MRVVWWILLLILDLTSGEDEVCSSMTFRLRSFRIVTSPCNYTTLPDSQLQAVQSWSLVVVLPVLQIVVLILAFPLNLLSLWILVFRTKRLPSTALLINLTITDLLLLVALPFRAQYHLAGNHWTLGEPLCRLVVALFYGNMYGSVLCLAFIAVDRYIALVHPFGAKTLRSHRTSLYMVSLVWAVVLAAMLPLLASRQTYDLDEPQITTCHDALPQTDQDLYFLPYFSSLFVVCFIVPFAVVVFCHGVVLRTLLREGKRYSHAVRVTVLVLVVFTLCFVPSNVLLLLTYADSNDDDATELYAPYSLSLALSTFNSLLDPIIYYYISSEFRDKAKSALCCRRGHMSADPSSSVQRSSTSGQRSKVTLLSRSQRTNQSSAV